MLLACYSHKHISYRIRTIIRKAILLVPNLRSSLIPSLVLPLFFAILLLLTYQDP
ncbi:hypothetical protein [Wolbachia endosymbiont (group A) of Ischnus inquisitorius]|uniref:hypothetical protein n=1 Tax=Wolbachia endosymbiont (group A) of Ischnus inquisitorius TaxID=3077922 RepID=UPI003132B7B8